MSGSRGYHGIFNGLFFVLLLAAQGLAVCVADEPYPNTIQALQERYQDEVAAHAAYGAYADKALEDGYPNSAYLFKSLAASEAIHARNFKRLLKELGVEVTPQIKPAGEVKSTRANIMHATKTEADEIDREYPAILKRIKPEHHQEAIDNLTWAWKAERQHRKLLGRMQDAAKNWFSFLIARIEGEAVDYHVCQICGSTLIELPAKQCPICKHPASEYRKIPYVAAERSKPEE